MMTPSQRISAWVRRVPTWPIYGFGLVMPAWLLWQGMTGGLGVEPISALEHRLGELALQFLILSLAITPIRDIFNVHLVKFRRSIGLVAFFFICLHFLVWLVLDVQVLSSIWADILKRPYITVGFVGFLLLIPLAVTSSNYFIRKMGPKKWRRLHQLSYAAGILGCLHFLMLVKGLQLEPIIYAVVLGGLLAYRVNWRALVTRQRHAS